jgi:hypothetical protein
VIRFYRSRMLLVFSAIGIGAVSAWSVSGRRLSPRNVGMTLVAMAGVAAEVKAICGGISIVVIALAMASTFVLRLVIRALLGARPWQSS